MKEVVFYSAKDLAQLFFPGSGFDAERAALAIYAQSAFEALVSKKQAHIEVADFLAEIESRDIPLHSKEKIQRVLEDDSNRGFACDVVYGFPFANEPLFVLSDRTPPHTCRFCGAPSWLDPSDQCAPPDYCHESDHGHPDDDEDFRWPSEKAAGNQEIAAKLQPNKANYSALADRVCAMIRDERDAVEHLLLNVELFLAELPDDLGRGSLNGWKTQLQHRISTMLATGASNEQG